MWLMVAKTGTNVQRLMDARENSHRPTKFERCALYSRNTNSWCGASRHEMLLLQALVHTRNLLCGFVCPTHRSTLISSLFLMQPRSQETTYYIPPSFPPTPPPLSTKNRIFEDRPTRITSKNGTKSAF